MVRSGTGNTGSSGIGIGGGGGEKEGGGGGESSFGGSDPPPSDPHGGGGDDLSVYTEKGDSDGKTGGFTDLVRERFPTEVWEECTDGVLTFLIYSGTDGEGDCTFFASSLPIGIGL